MIEWLNICIINHLQPKTVGEDTLYTTNKRRKKSINHVGAKGLKLKKLRFQLQRGLRNYLFDIHGQFNSFLTKTVQVDSLFHQILPIFNKFGRKRVKIEKFKIPASRGPAGCPDTHSCQISLSCDKNCGRR